MQQAGRFMVTGVMATAIHAGMVLALMTLVMPAPTQVVANGVAFVVANVFSYLLNSLWSFAVPLHGKRYLKFLLVSLVGFLGTLLLAFVAEEIGLTPAQGIFLIVSVMTPITFLLQRAWTFKQPNRPNALQG